MSLRAPRKKSKITATLSRPVAVHSSYAASRHGQLVLLERKLEYEDSEEPPAKRPRQCGQASVWANEADLLEPLHDKPCSRAPITTSEHNHAPSMDEASMEDRAIDGHADCSISTVAVVKLPTDEEKKNKVCAHGPFQTISSCLCCAVSSFCTDGVVQVTLHISSRWAALE